MTVIDVHTHMLTRDWLDLLQQEGGGYELKSTRSGQLAVHLSGAPFMTLMPQMLDYDLRLRDMDAAGVDIAIVSLTGPNVLWGTRQTSAEAARATNAAMAKQQNVHSDRIRWIASLPWEYEEDAVAELTRSISDGAVGVMVLGNIRGRNLTDPRFEGIWSEIDRLGLPVMVHPTIPQGGEWMGLDEFGLATPVGFMMDTTLAFGRIILSGFLDRYPNLKLIAPHAGATLPYLGGRLDRCYETIPSCRVAIKVPPSTYMRRIYFDTVVYDARTLKMCVETSAAENVLFGSDYPHNVGDMAGCLALVKGLPSDQTTKIGGANAARIFRL